MENFRSAAAAQHRAAAAKWLAGAAALASRFPSARAVARVEDASTWAAMAQVEKVHAAWVQAQAAWEATPAGASRRQLGWLVEALRLAHQAARAHRLADELVGA